MKSSLLEYFIFKPFSRVKAFTSTKKTFSENDFPRFTGKNNRINWNYRSKLAEIIGVEKERLVFPNQTHSSRVDMVSGVSQNKLLDVDALITNKKNICLCIQTADCVPILLYDRRKNVIGAIHAGWRGTVENIVEKTINMMIKGYKTNPIDIFVAIGPSISQEYYEVGGEVIEKVKKRIQKIDDVVVKKTNDKFLLDLWSANRQMLMMCGIPDSNIEICGECTFRNKENYFSARREGIETGRLVSGIMLIN